ncbi:MAG: helicase-related protein, partial [Candidatus Heimdallarchaeota archaeon]
PFNLNSKFLAGETVNRHDKNIVFELITTNPSFIIDQFLNKSRYYKFKDEFKYLQYLIFDEIHMYNARQIGIIKEWLSIVSPPFIIFLSATIGNLDELASFMTEVNSKKTKIFHGLASKATTRYIFLPNQSILDKAVIISEYFNERGITLIFANSIRETDDLRSELINYIATTSPKFRSIPVDNAKKILERIIIRHHSAISKDEKIKTESQLKFSGVMCFSPKTLAQGIDIGTVTRIVHIGFPATLAEFLQREGRSGRRSETSMTESVIFTSSHYDEIICRNEISFKEYIEGSPERILILKNSPVSILYRLLHTITLEKIMDLTDTDLFFLRSLELIDEDLNKITKKGKAYAKRYFSFYGQTYHINFLAKKGFKQERISYDDLKLKYQPATLHLKNGIVQQVKEYDPDRKNLTPIFERVNPKSKLFKLFKNNHLRSNVIVKEEAPEGLLRSKVLTEIKLIPVQITYNYFNYDTSQYSTYRSFSAKMYPVQRLTIFFKVENRVSPFNMEMAIHCFIEALRVTQDIRYTEIVHKIHTKESYTTLLIYESELSGLLLNINPRMMITKAHGLYSQYVRDHYTTWENISLLPLPSCRYMKKDDDIHIIEEVEKGFQNIKDQLEKLQENFIYFSKT